MSEPSRGLEVAMRRWGGLLCLLLGGCNAAPVANTLDYLFPPRMPLPNAPQHGGVAVPQLSAPVVVPAPPAAPVIIPAPASPLPPVPEGTRPVPGP